MTCPALMLGLAQGWPWAALYTSPWRVELGAAEWVNMCIYSHTLVLSLRVTGLEKRSFNSSFYCFQPEPRIWASDFAILSSTDSSGISPSSDFSFLFDFLVQIQLTNSTDEEQRNNHSKLQLWPLGSGKVFRALISRTCDSFILLIQNARHCLANLNRCYLPTLILTNYLKWPIFSELFNFSSAPSFLDQ